MTKTFAISEAEIQSQCMKYMRLLGILVWRNPIGPVLHRYMKGGAMQTNWKASPLKGFPDVSGVLKRKNRGRMFAIEFKSATGRLTPEQVEWHQNLMAAGALVATVKSFDDLLARLVEWGEIDPPKPRDVPAQESNSQKLS